MTLDELDEAVLAMVNEHGTIAVMRSLNRAVANICEIDPCDAGRQMRAAFGPTDADAFFGKQLSAYDRPLAPDPFDDPVSR